MKTFEEELPKKSLHSTWIDDVCPSDLGTLVQESLNYGSYMLYLELWEEQAVAGVKKCF